ncbi:hypothetical protein [Streptomyces daliensis]|uniref:Uncharacterized protein n=1 Tax=Streptomyces daliensis TaxID=299421 RepID=A0A8T4IYS3_9ACTN|nr:hypothetical protein [Streptomyces daliensis]
MSITQQYAMDTYRLSRDQQPPPPLPGAHEARVLHALWEGLRFRRRLRRHTGVAAATPSRR